LPDIGQAGDIESGSITSRKLPYRVAIVSDAFPERNGVGAYYHDLIEHLRPHLAGICLISPGGKDHVSHRWLRLPLPGDPTQRIVIPSPRQLARSLRRFAPDVVVLPTPGPYALIGLELARRSGTALIAGFHTHYEALSGLYWRRLARMVTRRYFDFCHARLFRYCPRVLANSPAMITVAKDMGARQVELIGTPVPPPFITTPAANPDVHLRSVLFAGRLAAEKNIDQILNAAARFPERRFTIAGDGPLRSLVIRRQQQLPNVRYLGWLPRSSMLATIDTHDLLLLPSKIESFGTVALEALARRRVVLVSSQCGITGWPTLRKGLFFINTNETLVDALRRIDNTDPRVIQRKIAFGEHQARRLNDWNTRLWLDIIARSCEHP